MEIKITGGMIHLLIDNKDNDKELLTKLGININNIKLFQFSFSNEEHYNMYINNLCTNISYKDSERYLLEVLDSSYQHVYRRSSLSFSKFPEKLPKEFISIKRELKINQIFENDV